MKISGIHLNKLRIPFLMSFKHASAERNITQSFLVIAQSDDGHIGYGEGCPRNYVTGESDESVIAFFTQHQQDIMTRIKDLSSIQEWQFTHFQEIDKNPAAWCALELALLDVCARHNHQPIEKLLGLPTLAGPFVYSAVLSATSAQQFSHTLQRYQNLGIHDYKIKLSGDLRCDRDNIRILRTAGIDPSRVRADANNLWTDVNIALDYLMSLEFAFAAIEEPLQPGQINDLTLLATLLKTRIILDESITQEKQLFQLSASPQNWIVNLRVSKMGGLLRSLNFLNYCRENKIAVIVGAQVGETSLLTRAGLIVAQAARDILIAQEGAFGTLLLESDAMQPCIMFGKNGTLELTALALDQSPGFGLTPIPNLAHRYLAHD